MLVEDYIRHFEQVGAAWFDPEYTRDVLVFGDLKQAVGSTVITTWCATNQVIETAIENQIKFIITHENPFYELGTKLKTPLRKATQAKQALLHQHQIAIYRCHDVWDRMPVYGVLDSWAELLALPFEKREVHSFYRRANFTALPVIELAQKLANQIKNHGQNGILVLGPKDKLIQSLTIGTGAITDIFDMAHHYPADAYLLTDDSYQTWIAGQWAIDHQIPILVVSHATSEMAGLENMSVYLNQQFPTINHRYCGRDFDYELIISAD